MPLQLTKESEKTSPDTKTKNVERLHPIVNSQGENPSTRIQTDVNPTKSSPPTTNSKSGNPTTTNSNDNLQNEDLSFGHPLKNVNPISSTSPPINSQTNNSTTKNQSEKS